MPGVACRTDCPIIGGGRCPRHGLEKTAVWVRLCVSRDNYFLAWEEGRGPGQGVQVRPPRRPRGPGGELRRILGCGWPCEFTRTMNAWGIEECLVQLDLITDWVVANGRRHGLPLAPEAARRLVRMAIHRATTAP